MTVYPAIDLMGGIAVRLKQGDPRRRSVVAQDPVGLARRWEAEGAAWLHLVDLDGALRGHPCHLDLVGSICAAVEIPVQVGGGLRVLGDIDAVLAAGAARAIIGTAALRPDFVDEALARYGDRLVVALDARYGIVVAEGWQYASGVSAVEVAGRLAKAGVHRFVYTDVVSDGMLAGPDIRGLAAVVAAAQVPVILSGGVATLDHLRMAATAGAEGAIVGSALYDGRFTLAQAVAFASGAK